MKLACIVTEETGKMLMGLASKLEGFQNNSMSPNEVFYIVNEPSFHLYGFRSHSLNKDYPRVSVDEMVCSIKNLTPKPKKVQRTYKLELTQKEFTVLSKILKRAKS